MSNKMKGVLKGLRYISQIFEEEEEPEMQIGLPTDVKHVAHIGWDGPTSNAPSWIQKFKEGDPGAPPNGDQQDVPKARGPRLPIEERRCSTGSDSILKSPSRRRSDTKGKGARRHSSAGSSSTDSPKRASTSENRTRNKLLGPGDSPSNDNTSSSKTTRRKKTKPGSSKSKPLSTTSELGYSDPGNGSKSKDSCIENDRNSLDDKARQIPAM